MAIAHDTSTERANVWQTGVATLSWSHTCSGSDRVLVVAVPIYSTSGARTTTGVTYNGVSMTLVNSIAASYESNTQNGSLWVLAGPASGTNTIQITYSGTCDFTNGFAASYTGVDQTTPVSASNTAQTSSPTSPSPTCEVTVSNSTSWLVGLGYGRDTTISGNTGTTVRQHAEGVGIGDSNGTVASGSRGLSFLNGSLAWPAVIVAALNDASGGGGGSNVPLNILVPKQQIFISNSGRF